MNVEKGWSGCIDIAAKAWKRLVVGAAGGPAPDLVVEP